MHISYMPIPGFERVVRAHDVGSGLVAFIAIHSTALGPALGGCRMWPFKSEDEALIDVLRLARGMTYKSAIADTGLGGGKSVIIGDPARDKTPALLAAMARFIAAQDGRYIAAEDVGTSSEDMVSMQAVTRWVAGLPVERGGSGDPAPLTAFGCFLGLKATVEERFQTASLAGLRVAVQGLGQVGFRLAGMLHTEGARLLVSDLDAERVADAERKFGATGVHPDRILGSDCDVLCPCALGGVLNDLTIPRLRCGAIAGAANNQLKEARHGDLLAEQGVLYAPDFVINAGGIIGISLEWNRGGFSAEEATLRVHDIPKKLRAIFRSARDGELSTHDAAVQIAEDRLSRRPGRSSLPPTRAGSDKARVQGQQ